MAIQLAEDNDADPEILDNNIQVKIAGKTYRCTCGSNVQSKLIPVTEGWCRYSCNGCGQEFEAK